MAKLPDKPKLPFTKWTRAKGKLYGYFNTGKKVNGKTVWAALPPFNSPGFFESYAAMKGARTKRGIIVYTVAQLVADYQASPEFKRLSPSSQKTYGYTLVRIVDQLGKYPIDKVARAHIREVVEKRIEGNGSRNLFLSVVGAMYKYARVNELTEAEPTKDMAPYKMGSHEPWPAELLKAGLAASDDRVRLAIHLLYFTGQRIGDVCKMRWADVKDGRIVVMQEKTGKPVNFRTPEALAAELDQTPRKGITILAQANGKPLVTETVRGWLKAFAKDLGFEAVPHGLRKNAVNSLLLAGATIAETASVTGQSFKLVEYYARQIDQMRLGDAAILKFERGTQATAEQTKTIQTDVQTTSKNGG